MYIVKCTIKMTLKLQLMHKTAVYTLVNGAITHQKS